MTGTVDDEPGLALSAIEAPLVGAVDMRATVRDALADDRVLLAYQPVVAVPDGRPAFHEGLIRVRSDDGLVLPAGQFIPAVETTELGRELDATALRLGTEMLARRPDLRLSINVSARSVGDRRWMDTLSEGLARDETVAERLILEITESAAMMIPGRVGATMAEIQDEGVSFALDDFGAGETCFRHLRDFCFDILKVDGTFVRDCDTDPRHQAILEAILKIARRLDMLTVAERVETEGEADFLVRTGYDCLQGFHYGIPSSEIADTPRPAAARSERGGQDGRADRRALR